MGRKVDFCGTCPRFFILSGYLFSEKTFKQTVRSGFCNLLLPYFATVVILLGVTRLYPLFPKLISEVKRHDLLIGAVYGSGTTIPFFLNNSFTISAIGAIWFLLAMFWGNLLFTAILKYSKKKLYVCTISASLVATLGFYLSHRGIYLPWSLNVALVSQVFYLGGYMIRKFELLQKNAGLWCGLGVILWGLSTQSGFFYLNVAQADAPFLAVLGGIGGSFVLMFLADKLTSKDWELKYLNYYGQMSLIVLCIHLLDLNGLNVAPKVLELRLKFTQNTALAVGIEILYRLMVTVIGIIVLPKLPYLRSFYLNRKYPFGWEKSKAH